TYRNAGDLPQALTLYQRFLREEPDSPFAPDALGYVEELKERIRKQQAEQAERAEMERTNERLGQTTRVLSERLARLDRIQKQPKSLYRRGWFWGALAGAAAGLGLSVGLAVGLAPHLPASVFGNRTLNF